MQADWVWTAVGLAAAAFTSTSFIPQLILRLRRPAEARVSYGTLAAFIIGASLWTLYGLHLQDTIVIGANLFILATLIAITLLQIIQDRGPKA